MVSINNILQKDILCIPGRLDCCDATHSVLFSYRNSLDRLFEYSNISAGLAYTGWRFYSINIRACTPYAGSTVFVVSFIF